MKTLPKVKARRTVELVAEGSNMYGTFWDVKTTTEGARWGTRLDKWVRNDPIYSVVKCAHEESVLLTRVVVDGVTLTRTEIKRRIVAELLARGRDTEMLGVLVAKLMTAVERAGGS